MGALGGGACRDQLPDGVHFQSSALLARGALRKGAPLLHLDRRGSRESPARAAFVAAARLADLARLEVAMRHSSHAAQESMVAFRVSQGYREVWRSGAFRKVDTHVCGERKAHRALS